MAVNRIRSLFIIPFIVGIVLLVSNAQRVQAAPAVVINGSDVVEGEQPGMVAILLADVTDLYSAQFCGGTLINAEWVMTAAHCTFDLDYSPFAGYELEVMSGSTELSTGAGVRVAVDRIVRHRDFDFATYHNDIALLHLAEPLANAEITSFVHNVNEVSLSDIATATVFGWGVTEEGFGATSLKRADLPVVSQDICGALYAEQGYEVAETMVCAGYLDGGIDACAGDSGGPLMTWDEQAGTWVQIGIVSAGAGCAEPGYYGLYTEVADYFDWINNIAGTPQVDPDYQPLLALNENSGM